MDIYSRKSRWKIYLAIGGILIVLTSMVYTNYLANQIAKEEKKRVQVFATAQSQVTNPSYEPDFSIHQEILTQNTTIPIILVSETGGLQGYNFGESKDTSTLFLERQLHRLKAKGVEPITGGFGYGNEIYFKDSSILTLIKYFPIFQFILIAAFVLFGYLAFSSARRAEQNRVWVGMAKETAHQLGTPISGIVAWIEHLKGISKKDKEATEVLSELRNDVTRLELIAERFSKIGSTPNLETVNVYEELEKCRAYMERRAPRKVVFEFPPADKGQMEINVNPPLFDWVVENLLRNALDAMDGSGKISAEVYDQKDSVFIDISDTGKGIPAGKFKTVFQPGYSTKKRGWGLGLSLAKRIIEQYHSGRIFVKKSAINEGTTFTIQLPKTVNDEPKAKTS